MKRFFQFFLLGTSCLFSSASAIEEDIQRPVLSQYSPSSYPLSSYAKEDESKDENSKKYFPFLSVSSVSSDFTTWSNRVIPGIGLSKREGTTATDISILPLVIVNTLGYAKSKIFYKNPKNTGVYCSCGLGGVVGVTLPISWAPLGMTLAAEVPLRAGFEGKKRGFIDMGIILGGGSFVRLDPQPSLTFYPYIAAELRTGLKF